MNCKNCGKKYHYCTSCGPIDYCDEGYCSDKCWRGSKEYQNIKIDFLNFCRSLNKEQRQFFINYISDGYINYNYESEEWLKEEFLNERKG